MSRATLREAGRRAARGHHGKKEGAGFKKKPANGDKKADFALQLKGLVDLKADDFLI